METERIVPSQSRESGVCPVCASPAQLLDRPLDAWLCETCRHTFIATLPAEAEIAELYATYGYDTAGPDTVPPFLDRIIDAHIRSFARFKKTGRLLDVGFGHGALLRLAAASGWEAHGIELSPAAVELGRK